MPKHADPRKLKFYFEPLPVPENLLSESDTWDTVCVQIPVPLIPYITPILRIWESPGCLIGTQEERAFFNLLITDLIAKINSADTCGDLFMLRQNPLDLCQLQQSFNGGLAWSLAFDYSLCLSPQSTFFGYLQILNLFAQWATVISNTEINQYAPTGTFTSSPGESQSTVNSRKLALCYSVDMYVHAYVEAIRKINHDAATAGNIANLGFGLLTALAAIFTIGTGGAGLPLYMAVGAAAGAVGIAGFVGITDAVLNDSAAIAEIVCCMYGTLKNIAPTSANFATAVNSCSGLSANAELIRTALARDISAPQQLANQFNAFINLLGDELKPAELGLLPACPCEAGNTAYQVAILGRCGQPVDSSIIFTPGVPVSFASIQNSNPQHHDVTVLLPAGNWHVIVSSFTGVPGAAGENPDESAICYFDTSGVFHNLTWAQGGSPDVFEYDVSNGVYNIWCSTQAWSIFLGNTTAFVVDLTITAI